MEKTIFQKIIDREIPAKIIYEDDEVISFLDVNPFSKGHFLVVPKKYSKNIIDIDEENLVVVIKKVKQLAIEQMKKNDASGFKILINNEEDAGQEVLHTHFHIMFYYKK